MSRLVVPGPAPASQDQEGNISWMWHVEPKASTGHKWWQGRGPDVPGLRVRWRLHCPALPTTASTPALPVRRCSHWVGHSSGRCERSCRIIWPATDRRSRCCFLLLREVALLVSHSGADHRAAEHADNEHEQTWKDSPILGQGQASRGRGRLLPPPRLPLHGRRRSGRGVP